MRKKANRFGSPFLFSKRQILLIYFGKESKKEIVFLGRLLFNPPNDFLFASYHFFSNTIRFKTKDIFRRIFS